MRGNEITKCVMGDQWKNGKGTKYDTFVWAYETFLYGSFLYNEAFYLLFGGCTFDIAPVK